MASLLARATPFTGRAPGQTHSPVPSTSWAARARPALHARPAAPLRTRRAGSSGAVRAQAGDGLEGYPPEISDALKMIRDRNSGTKDGPGDVYIVGTGPGDPGLLTMRAVQMMQTADVILYDRLVSPDILAYCHEGAQMIYVGKQVGFHTRTQDEIHQLLLEFSFAGATVVRLKGGDPFVFGRGGEEAAYLEAHGIRMHVVPGITAAAGIAAELGVPLTHRGIATSVRFLTGHLRDGAEDELDEAFQLSGDTKTTLVVYMGLGTLPALTTRLEAAGLPLDTPALAVERGTTPEQRIVHARLRDLSGATHAAGLQSPTLIIIGEVVALGPGWQAWEAAGCPEPAAREHGAEVDALRVVFPERELPDDMDAHRFSTPLNN